VILAVYSSPRQGGNTDILMDSFLAGMPDEITVKKVMLRTLELQPCIACGSCEKDEVCIFQDDIWSIYEKLEKAKALVIASPIYFANVPAQLKTFIDRAQPFWVRKYLNHKENMPLTERAFFLAAGAIDTDKYFKNARLVIKTFLINLDITYSDGLFFPGVDDKGDIYRDEKALKRVQEAGRMFVRPYINCT